MDRSPAGRVAIGRSLGSLSLPRWRPAGRPGARSRTPRRASGRTGGRGLALPSLTAPLRWLGALVRGHRRLRITLLLALVAVPALTAGWLWLRNSPLVAVERVQVVGVHGPEAQSIEAALVGAARHMSTLDVHSRALLAAVAPYRVVRELEATASFPHGLRIRVVEQLPVAALAAASGRTAVAADGVVLGPALLSGSLPLLAGGSGHTAIGPSPGQRVREASSLACLAVLGAAPAPLAKAAVRVFTGPKGVTVVMRDGLRVYFGDASRPQAKWLSLERVLADPSSAGATYVDVRVPERPAAGLPGTTAPEAPASETPASGSSASTSPGELAAKLAAALEGTAPRAPRRRRASPRKRPPPRPPRAAPAPPGKRPPRGPRKPRRAARPLPRPPGPGG